MDAQLRKYGIEVDQNFKVLSVDTRMMFDAVTNTVTENFGIGPHRSYLHLYEKGGYENFAKEIVEKRSKIDGKEYADNVTESDYPAMWYVSDLKLSFTPQMDYLVTLNKNSDIFYALLALGEEIAHGEHTCHHIETLGSFLKYDERFDYITKEFIGSLGRKLVEKDTGISSPDEGNIEIYKSDKRENVSIGGAAHFIAYQFSQQTMNNLISHHKGDMREKLNKIFVSDKAELWKIVLNLGEFEINDIFEKGVIERILEKSGLSQYLKFE